jgi:hypothetical protein
MIQTYDIPRDASRSTLETIHNEILAHNSDIRPSSRWGRFTEYSIKLKKREAQSLLDDALSEEGSAPWRLIFGADHEEPGNAGLTLDAQYYDGEVHLWRSTFLDRDAEDERSFVDRVLAWLREHHPAAEALIEIDRRLLDDGLELRDWIAHVRQLVEDSGRSQRQIALELGINPSLFGRAIDPGNERPSPEVTARIAAALGEEWREERVWRPSAC